MKYELFFARLQVRKMAEGNRDERRIQTAEMKLLTAVNRRNRKDVIRKENIVKIRTANKLFDNNTWGLR